MTSPVAMARCWRSPALLAIGGLVAACGLAISEAMSASHTFVLLRDSVVGAGAVGILAGVSLRVAQRARVGVQVAVAVVAPVVAVAAGVMWVAWSMFLTGEDLNVLGVVLVSAGTVGIVCAWVLGRRVGGASRELALMARRLEVSAPGGPAVGAPADLARVAAELGRTSARLVQARAEAAATEQARRDLVAWVSHDLRTSLSGINLMAEALEERVVDDPRHRGPVLLDDPDGSGPSLRTGG